MVLMELQYSGRASLSSMEEEEVLEEGGLRPGKGLVQPSLPLTIYRGKGEVDVGVKTSGSRVGGPELCV